MANIYDMADTWNDAGTVFTAIKMNVTDTASDADSLLMDLQVGGTSVFNVNKSDQISIASAGGLRAASSTIIDIMRTASAVGVRISSGLVSIGNTRLGFSGTNPTTSDLIIRRDAANTLAQQNGANPQTLRIYNTYTSDTDYERAFIKWDASILKIGTEADGTGTQRTLRINGSQTELQAGGNTQITCFSSYSRHKTYALFDKEIAVSEMSPAPTGTANRAIIFAEDNGSGKTRLMVQFGTGAAQQIAIEP